MKIAYFTNNYPSVSHTFIRREILEIEKNGFSVKRIALRGWENKLTDPVDEQERTKTQYILRSGVFPLLAVTIFNSFTSPFAVLKTLTLVLGRYLKSDKSLLMHIFYLVEAIYLAKILQDNKIEHFHVHFATNSADVALLASKISGISYSLTIHGPEEFDKPISLGLGLKIKNAKFVASISSFTRSQLYRWCDYVDWKKIKVVRCGLEKNFYINPQGIGPHNNHLVCVGRLCEQKGQLLLVEAARLLKDENIDFRLTLAGDGEMRHEIEILIRKYNLQEQINITGWISSAEVREFIEKSRALVLPSFAEGLPVVLMEALSLQRPVLTTYIAGIPELVVDGVNGWLFPAGDVEKLALVMKECLSKHDNEICRMGEAGRENVIRLHDIETEAKKLADFIRLS